MSEYTMPDQKNKNNPVYEAIDSKDFVAQTEKARERIIDNLPETRPYPLLHYTEPSVAAKAMVDGLISIAAAKETNQHIPGGNNWQGENLISVTDLEGYANEQRLDPIADTTFTEELSTQEAIRAAAEIALGIREPVTQDERSKTGFWNRGGVCLLLNPKLKRYYGGQSSKISRDQAEMELLGVGSHSGSTVRYGGGYTGEAVVPDRIDSEEIYGVLLSSHFTDSDISETFDTKAASLDSSAPIDYFRTFNDEINLLGLFDLLDDDMKQGVGYMREQYEKAAKLHFTINDPTSFTNLVLRTPETNSASDYSFFGGQAPEEAGPETGEYRKELLMQQERDKAELKMILDDPTLQKYAKVLLEAGKNLTAALKNAGISTYSELMISLAKIQGIPVYDKKGMVIWPDEAVTVDQFSS